MRFALGGLFLASIASATPTGFPTTTPVRFVVLGDTGTGGAGQYAVAKAVERLCAERGCQFALDLGDNIYEFGPQSARDPQFQDKFEKPYASLKFPFFMALGNHDQSGTIPGSGVYPEKGDYEVEYTSRSSKWMMPHRYYEFAAPFAKADDYTAHVPSPIVDFFAIDTNPLAPQNMPQHQWYRPHEKYDARQRAWLRESIGKSSSSWKIVFGHHPYRNNGKHSNAGEFEGLGLAKGRELKTMYEEEICGKVDLLITGHDHSLQWLEPHPACGKRPQFIISGAGAKSNDANSKKSNPAVWEAYGTLGFFWIEATPTRLKIAGYTVDENGAPKQTVEKTIQK